MKTLIAALIALSAVTSVASARPIPFPPQFDGPAFGPADIRSFDGPAQTWTEGGNQR